ncbi:Formate/nitrite transporter [Pseudomassariella vexata]|uniref:Formate/nitrite transporter n=1 Tax=Pseudomassariella vexata TaxID=1141098 RepID=A0A1Y2E7X7_9PEZI|nr:Formate/nitrite transporter [Pseudomassariella vexata]ORY67424.1 Formate/nitrite transporter [Pseudomassariella vexata]
MVTHVHLTNFASYTPAETIEIVSRTGVKKGNMRADKVFLSSVSAGCLSAFAAGSYLIICTSPWLEENAPGLLHSLGAFVFPYGLVFVVLTGADLCNGSFLFTAVAALHGRLPVWRMLLHWFLCFWGNLAGCLFVVLILFGYGGTFDEDPFKSKVIALATQKQITPTWVQIFLRGIGCNWLVALACFLGLQGRDLTSKIAGLWLPIFAFVSVGFDHVVANMTFMPLGLWIGTPGLTIGLYIWKGIIPSLLGNIIGATIFGGGYYYYMHILGAEDIYVDGAPYVVKGDGVPVHNVPRDLESSGSSVVDK